MKSEAANKMAYRRTAAQSNPINVLPRVEEGDKGD